MKKNVGKVDRLLRLVGGFILVVISIIMKVSGTLPIIFMILGILLILTGIGSICPAYIPFKINTNKVKE